MSLAQYAQTTLAQKLSECESARAILAQELLDLRGSTTEKLAQSHSEWQEKFEAYEKKALKQIEDNQAEISSLHGALELAVEESTPLKKEIASLTEKLSSSEDFFNSKKNIMKALRSDVTVFEDLVMKRKALLEDINSNVRPKKSQKTPVPPRLLSPRKTMIPLSNPLPRRAKVEP